MLLHFRVRMLRFTHSQRKALWHAASTPLVVNSFQHGPRDLSRGAFSDMESGQPELLSQHERRSVGLTSPRRRRQNVVLYAGDAAERTLIQEHELRYACDPKSSRRAKFNVLLVRLLSVPNMSGFVTGTLLSVITPEGLGPEHSEQEADEHEHVLSSLCAQCTTINPLARTASARQASYEMLARDAGLFQRYEWETVIVDEGAPPAAVHTRTGCTCASETWQGAAAAPHDKAMCAAEPRDVS